MGKPYAKTVFIFGGENAGELTTDNRQPFLGFTVNQLILKISIYCPGIYLQLFAILL